MDDLAALLRKREREDSNRNYSSEQMKVVLSERLKTSSTP